MDISRRTTLAALTAGVTTGIAGCNSLTFGGKQEYTPVVLENNHDTPHMMAFNIQKLLVGAIVSKTGRLRLIGRCSLPISYRKYEVC
ncbi:hypothetical protein DM867_03875 [Halosegnis rubeus]|uniref:Uncharacterized protein n=1 Tax=Halosegnis rubeus TaxID=2212850 RepID=A0A5N5U9B9_9EURY|nr:hypothetical protein [Halosegnis rubeus]KAB7515225.1 hypothetical protein DMP03_08255 [Halosegnis rubeus]KAB7516279.1 hypothetical protein DM867_03875 [Halosegnis rubeus]KAB7517733.1 hypothetical protein DP108_09245 [Halosegnis rubeus]